MRVQSRVFEEALAICRSALPKDHPDIGGTLGSLGGVQTELRDYAGAKQSLEEAWPSAAKRCPRATPTSPKASTTWGPCRLTCGV